MSKQQYQYRKSTKAMKRKMAKQQAREQQEWICLIAFIMFFCTVIYLYFRG